MSKLLDSTLLEADDVSLRYGKEPRTRLGKTPVYAVNGVSFDLRRGEVLGIVGESGCGKSSLARLLMGLEEPTRGSINYRGRDIQMLDRMSMRSFRRGVQIVFQDPYSSLNPRMTAMEIVAEPYRIHRGYLNTESEIRGRVIALLELVGLSGDHLGRFPHQFSGGQRQRLGIARALALEPEVLICDEAVSALDVSIQAQILNLLRKIKTEMGVSIIFISHDLSVVRHVSDRVAVMYYGEIVEIGRSSDIFDNPQHPYTRVLLDAIPQVDTRDRSMRIRARGDLPSGGAPPKGCYFYSRCPIARDMCHEEHPSLEAPGDKWPTRCFFPGEL